MDDCVLQSFCYVAGIIPPLLRMEYEPEFIKEYMQKELGLTFSLMIHPAKWHLDYDAVLLRHSHAVAWKNKKIWNPTRQNINDEQVIIEELEYIYIFLGEEKKNVRNRTNDT